MNASAGKCTIHKKTGSSSPKVGGGGIGPGGKAAGTVAVVGVGAAAELIRGPVTVDTGSAVRGTAATVGVGAAAELVRGLPTVITGSAVGGGVANPG